MLEEIVHHKYLQANAITGIFPANSIGESVEVYQTEKRDQILETFHFLRQQKEEKKEKKIKNF